ncbi:MAG: hypothetical protein ABR907_03170 [Terracidiphilus sp.]|jgi:ribosome maturation factor RimP
MKYFSRTLTRCIGMVLVCALLAPMIASAAPKSLTPQQVYARVHKLGVGSWLGVRLQSGSAFSGKVISIDKDSFGLQRYGETEPAAVAYSDVAFLEMEISTGSLRRKALTPGAIHARLLKRGLGNWVALQLGNGVAFSGRIVRIDENSFGLQLYGDSRVTPVAYSDVVYLETGTPAAVGWIMVGVFVVTGVVVPIVAIHEFNENRPKMPTLPPQPIFP